MSMYLKRPGNLVYLVGVTGDDLGGSLARRLLGREGGRAPVVHLSSARRVFSAIHRANRKGLIQACHDLSEGGLAVAAAEMAIAGGHGLDIDVRDVPVTDPELAGSTRLFAESPTRFLVEITPADAPALEALLGRTPHARIGRVLDSPRLRVLAESGVAIDANIETLRSLWQAPLTEVTR
jgi:phosphoribosylformylglycinamidine (FGAM) synthase-like enzyme